MEKLSTEAFEKAKIFLEKNGRELDLARFRFLFEKGSKEDVSKALKLYQCENGGFGHMLEPDHQTVLPSCYTTSIAFQWMESLELQANDSMLQKALTYLKENYNETAQLWPAFPKEANNDPHAIWWHRKEGEEFCDAEKTWGLPSAEILGILLKYDLSNELWEKCFAKAIARIDEVSPKMEMNEAFCYVGMTYYLDGEKRRIVDEKMFPIIENIIETDERKWGEYSAKPLMFIHAPSSPFYDSFKESISKNIDWELKQQRKEGFWTPEWEWYRDEEFWPKAREEWQSYLTVEKLALFERFGR